MLWTSARKGDSHTIIILMPDAFQLLAWCEDVTILSKSIPSSKKILNYFDTFWNLLIYIFLICGFCHSTLFCCCCCYCMCCFKHFCKIAKRDYQICHVCPSVRPSICMEQLGSHWTDFHEIWYLSIFRKSVKKIQVSFTLDKSKRYFTWRRLDICDHILFRSS
jgi:hypothetical protein